MRTATLTALFLATPIVAVCALSARAEAATQLELKDMAARVIVTPEDRADIDLKVKNNPNLPKITVRVSGDKMIVSGQLAHKIKGCGRDVKIIGVGTVRYDDLPVIHVRTPRDVKISAQSAVLGQIAESRSLDLSVAKCGDWKIKTVSGNLKLSNAGAADIAVASGGVTHISSAGSGDISLGNLKSLTVESAGSADIKAGDVSGPVSISTGGAGDSVVNSVKGNITINTAGAGDVSIARGTAPQVKINIAGSGDVHFGGVATAVEASIVGSGDVTLAKVNGTVTKNIIGSGDVRVRP